MKISRSFSPATARSLALLAAPLATVRIVPSFGFITALYAVSTAFSHAEARIATLISSYSLITLLKPLNSWDKITPELPLAPLREPDEIALAKAAILGSLIAATSLAADIIVIDIFVPVSPSGTGKTFNSLIHSFLCSKFFAPARNIFESICASIIFKPTSRILLNLLLERLQQRCWFFRFRDL